MAGRPPHPSTTLAIILGVSECPRATSLEALPQCLNSAVDFRDHLLSEQEIPADNVKFLFDCKLQPSQQIDEIEEWIGLRRNALQLTNKVDAQDLIIFYSGHGGFTRNDQAYYLATWTTREGAEGSSSIRYNDFASSIRRCSKGMRRFLILDCCFSAASVKFQVGVNALVLKKVEEALPPEGTAVLCSSASHLASIAHSDERHTMFSGALLSCLGAGSPDEGELFSLEQLGDTVQRFIQTKYSDHAVRPELHVPDQDRGNPAKIGLFRNAAHKTNQAIRLISAEKDQRQNRDLRKASNGVINESGIGNSGRQTSVSSTVDHRIAVLDVVEDNEFSVKDHTYVFSPPARIALLNTATTLVSAMFCTIPESVYISPSYIIISHIYSGQVIPGSWFYVFGFTHQGVAFGLVIGLMLVVQRKSSIVKFVLSLVLSTSVWVAAWNSMIFVDKNMQSVLTNASVSLIASVAMIVGMAYILSRKINVVDLGISSLSGFFVGLIPIPLSYMKQGGFNVQVFFIFFLWQFSLIQIWSFREMRSRLNLFSSIWSYFR